MATGPSAGGRGRGAGEGGGEGPRQLASESKLAPLTTEFWAYVAAVLAVLIAGLASDEFDASSVWLFVTILTDRALYPAGLETPSELSSVTAR